MRKLLPLLLLLCGSCGGKNGTIALKIVVSPNDDPFGSAANVRITVGAGLTVETKPVINGKFDFTFDQAPMKMASEKITIEALDAAGNVIAYGVTPPLSLEPLDQGPYGVWVGRPGRVAAAASQFGATVVDAGGNQVVIAAPRAEMAAASVPGVGVLFAGGRDSTGAPLKTALLYSIFTHTTIEVAPMSSARAGGVAAAVGSVRAAVVGGSAEGGFGKTGAALDSGEVFDPTVNLGLWAALPTDGVAPRSYPSICTLSSGARLISGGADANGPGSSTAVILTVDASPRMTQVATPMVSKRIGHASIAARFPDGEGALLFGGVVGTSAVAERLIGQTFSAYDVGAVPSRSGSAAVDLPDGRLLIIGGNDGTGPLASVLVIQPTVPAAGVTSMDLLSVAREKHSATRVGNEILVCGGLSTGAKANNTCDVLDATTLQRKDTLTLGTARHSHSAVALETGPILIGGGFGADALPLSSLEIYTPAR